jgi:hypothetical protein
MQFWLHTTVRKKHKTAIAESGVTPFVLYSLRHTFLTRLGEAGCDVWTLARIAGLTRVDLMARSVERRDWHRHVQGSASSVSAADYVNVLNRRERLVITRFRWHLSTAWIKSCYADWRQ